MALAVAVKKRRQTGFGLVALVQITASGSYAASGDALDLAAAVGYTNRRPDFVEISGIAGFVYQYDGAAKKMWVRCNTAGGADGALGEHSTGAYAAGVTGDTILALAYWLAVPQLPAI